MRPSELNLLVVFNAVMIEKSVTRAAEHLSMTQPAVSNAVSRMRVLWKDELFVKDGRNIKPTNYAINLWEQIKTPLSSIEGAIGLDKFDPMTTKRTFRVAANDISVDSVWGELYATLENSAPNANIHTMPLTFQNALNMLVDSDVDLAISPVNPLSSEILSYRLFDDQFVCVMRPAHALHKREISLTEFAEANHLLVSLSGESEGLTDKALQEYGLTRKVAMVINTFSSAPKLIMETNLIAMLPIETVYKHVMCGELVIVSSPITLPKLPILMLWHKRQQYDQGLCWFKDQLAYLYQNSWNQKTKKLQESGLLSK